MKKFRTLTAGILASAMVMSMTAGFSAFAVEDGSETTVETPSGTTYTITVTNEDTDTKTAHKYEAYQVFKGVMQNMAEDGEEENLQLDITGWGDGINGSALIVALKADATIGTSFTTLTETSTAKNVADILSDSTKFSPTDANMQAFAKIVGANLSTTKKDSADAKQDANGKYSTDIQVTEAGYYLVKDTDGSPNPNQSAKTRYILTTTDAIQPTAKSDFPTISKNIIEGNNETKTNTAAIGDTVVYQLKSKVPDMTGYNKYYYIVNDTMSKGLTLDYDATKLTGITVTVGTETLTNQNPNDDDTPTDKEFYVETTAEADGKTKIKVVFKNFKQYEKDAPIVISYNATLNENANVGSVGNPNVVDLTFSNDPNYDYFGSYTPDSENPGKPGKPEKPDEPNPGDPENPNNPENPKEPTGKTPEEEVITYTTAIKLTKIDKNSKDMLNGAVFKIEGKGVNSTLKATYTKDNENGTFYKLADGKYTDKAPDGTNNASYDNPEQKYSVVFDKVDKENVTKADLTLTDSVLEIRGLNPGTYTITETTPADGGYIIGKPATIVITADPSSTICNWSYTCSGGNVEGETVESDGTLSFKYTNVKGITLPGTGAFGTKLIYALGTLFTGTGAAYMVSKKKSKKDE